MTNSKRYIATALTSVVLGVLASPAAAQQFNDPVSIGRGGSATPSGMSLGYRQAIIEEELLNRRPDTLVRDARGALLEIERRNSSQAFIRRQASPFVPGTAASAAGGGVRLSVGGVGIGGVGSGGDGQGGSRAGGTVVISSQTPIESWINQLYSGHNRNGAS